MRKGWWKSAVSVMAAVVLLAMGAWLIGHINQQRAELELDTADPIRDTTVTAPIRVPTVALFTVRSLIIDYLWIRADQLKNDGYYFDALPLRQMICSLQPQLPSVWLNQAWDMAYNISVGLPTAPERWNWVMAGISLLRDQGLYYNPETPELYRELGWIFQHKIGGTTDNFHRYYKERLAFEMMMLLGPDEPSMSIVRELAEVPQQWQTVRADPAVAELADRLIAAEPSVNTDEDLVAAVIAYRRRLLEQLLRKEQGPPPVSEAFITVFEENRENPSLRAIDLYARANHLRETWKLDPAEMLAVNREYGPIDLDEQGIRYSLDWRLPWPHAIYWYLEGIRHAEEDGVTRRNLKRGIYHCLQELFHYGRLQVLSVKPLPTETDRPEGREVLTFEDPAEMRVFLSQDLRMFPIAYAVTEEILRELDEIGSRMTGGFEGGSINLLKAGIVNLYLVGHKKMARRYFAHLMEISPKDRRVQQGLQGEFEQASDASIEAFIRSQMLEEVKNISPRNASNYINGFLRDSFSRFALRDDENARFRETWARQVYQVFRQQYPDPEDRVALPEFSVLRRTALFDFLDDPRVDPMMKRLLLQRIQLDDPSLYESLQKELESRQPRQQPPSP